jgi:hypothetical protein
VNGWVDRSVGEAEGSADGATLTVGRAVTIALGGALDGLAIGVGVGETPHAPTMSATNAGQAPTRASTRGGIAGAYHDLSRASVSPAILCAP